MAENGFDRDEVRGDMKQENSLEGGRQAGGGPGASDMAAPGGSSGTGGYGNDQNSQNHQGQGQGERTQAPDPHQSRGERFDEQQGGGRGAESVSFDKERDGDDFAEDQQAHQDRGQGIAEEEREV
ncbi:MAG TPA: hypothetical protein VF552_16270 [Allosphingosinicella sp.]|jgi:hypothetical protein